MFSPTSTTNPNSHAALTTESALSAPEGSSTAHLPAYKKAGFRRRNLRPVVRLGCQRKHKFVDKPPPYKPHPRLSYGFLDSSGSQRRAENQPARFPWLGGRLFRVVWGVGHLLLSAGPSHLRSSLRSPGVLAPT